MSAQGIHIFQKYYIHNVLHFQISESSYSHFLRIYTMSCTFRFQRVVIHIFLEYSRLTHDVNGECGKEGK